MKSQYVIVISMLLLMACSYEPSGDFFSDIVPPSGSNSSIELGSQTDPIDVFWPTSFAFQVTPVNQGAYQAVVTFEGGTLLSSESSNGYFTFILDPGSYANGVKELKITASHLTNSKSLAGQLSAEVIIFSKTYQVNIDNVKPDKIQAPSVAIEDGKMMIRWLPPNKFNFQKLFVLRSYNNGATSQTDTLKLSSNDGNSYHDHSYVGGDVRYTVDMKSPGSYLKGNETSFSCVPISLSYDAVAGRLTWSKSLLYGNSLQILYKDFEFAPVASEGGYDLIVRFGETQMATVKIIALKPESYQTNQYVIIRKIFRGVECSTFDRIQYLPNDNSYQFIKSGFITKVDATTYSSLFSTQLSATSLMVSDNATNAYLWNGNFLSNGLGLHRWNTSTLSISESYDLKTIIGYPSGPLENVRVTNTNLLAGGFYGGVSSSYILDMNSKTVVWEGQGPIILSPDGNFMLKDNVIYSRGNNTWNTMLGKISLVEGIERLTFRQDGVANILYASTISGQLYIFNLNGSLNGNGEFPQIVHGLPPPPLQGYQYDRFTNSLYSIGSGSDGQVRVFDANTFQIKQTFASIYEIEKVRFENGSLFHQNGFVIPRSN